MSQCHISKQCTHGFLSVQKDSHATYFFINLKLCRNTRFYSRFHAYAPLYIWPQTTHILGWVCVLIPCPISVPHLQVGHGLPQLGYLLPHQYWRNRMMWMIFFPSQGFHFLQEALYGRSQHLHTPQGLNTSRKHRILTPIKSCQVYRS